MSQRYNLEKIKVLLTEVFTDEELRRFCYDTLEFIPVYKQLRRNTHKAQVIHQLVNYADQNSQLSTLLNWAKTHNPTAYEKHQLYYDISAEGTALEGKLLQAFRDPMWQMVGAIIAILALGWAVYTFYAGEGISGSATSTATPTPKQSTIIAIPPPPTVTLTLQQTRQSDTKPLTDITTMTVATASESALEDPLPDPGPILTLRITNTLLGTFDVKLDYLSLDDNILDSLLKFRWPMGQAAPLAQFPLKIGDGIYLLVPWRIVQEVHKEAEHVVVLNNGQALRGQLDGFIFTTDGKKYSLAEIINLEVIELPKGEQDIELRNQGTAVPWQLQIGGPVALTFDVYNPRFAVRYCYGLMCSDVLAPEGFRITETASFYFEGEESSGPIYLEDLEVLASSQSQDSPKQLKIQSKSGAEIAGILSKFDAVYLNSLRLVEGARAGSGWYLVTDYSADGQVVMVILDNLNYSLRRVSATSTLTDTGPYSQTLTLTPTPQPTSIQNIVAVVTMTNGINFKIDHVTVDELYNDAGFKPGSGGPTIPLPWDHYDDYTGRYLPLIAWPVLSLEIPFNKIEQAILYPERISRRTPNIRVILGHFSR